MNRRLAACTGDPTRAVAVAAYAEVVVGYAEVRLMQTLQSGERAEIVGLVVDERHRRRRVGTALARWARDWAMAHGQSKLRVRTNVVRDAAAEFYTRQGFHHVKQQHVFELRLIDPE